jgi:hypothetical protein
VRSLFSSTVTRGLSCALLGWAPVWNLATPLADVPKSGGAAKTGLFGAASASHHVQPPAKLAVADLNISS